MLISCFALLFVRMPSAHSQITSPSTQTDGAFGASVAVDGNTVVVGADGEAAGGFSGAGHAYIYNAETGALVATLTSPNAYPGGLFGRSVAVNGNTIVVGADGETAGGYSQAGNAYFFNVETGALVANLTSPNAQTNGYFGVSVAVDGNTVVVGASGEDSHAGNAYIYNAETGALVANLTSPNAQTDGSFGYSVAVSGNTIVVGAHGESNGENAYQGHAYIFNAETGNLVATLTSPNAEGSGAFGWSVAVNGNTIVVGAYWEVNAKYIERAYAGNAYIFNAETGNLVATLTSPNAQTYGDFGYAVALNGNMIAVGAVDETAGGYSQAGNAYFFNVETGALVANLTSPSTQTDGAFGASVAVDGNTVVVGADGEAAGGFSGAGHAYIYNAETGALVATLTSPNVTTSSSSTTSTPPTSTMTLTTSAASRAPVSTTTPTTTMGQTTSATTPSSSTSSAPIPEFPVQLGFALLVTVAIVASYVLAKRSLRVGKQLPI